MGMKCPHPAHFFNPGAHSGVYPWQSCPASEAGIDQTVGPTFRRRMFLETPKPTPHPIVLFFRKTAILLATLVTLLVFGVIFCNLWICGSTHKEVYDQVEDVPARDVGLVLGTSRFIAPDTPNLHFINRVEAAARLLESGNVKHLLVSGDNRTNYYNEPRDLRESLIARGVPRERITCDFAGLRTLDSVIRAREVFGQEALVIISDDFHVPRAVFIAKAKGIDAIGLKCARVPRIRSQRSRVREWFARVKAILDLYLFEAEPRHVGDPVAIRLAERKEKTASPSPPEEPGAEELEDQQPSPAPGETAGVGSPGSESP